MRATFPLILALLTAGCSTTTAYFTGTEIDGALRYVIDVRSTYKFEAKFTDIRLVSSRDLCTVNGKTAPCIFTGNDLDRLITGGGVEYQLLPIFPSSHSSIPFYCTNDPDRPQVDWTDTFIDCKSASHQHTQSLRLSLVLAGLATVDPATTNPLLRLAEQKAKTAKVGIWKGTFQPVDGPR